MLHFTQVYDSPSGLRIREYECETYEEGKREAEKYRNHPCVEEVALSFYCEPAGEPADERGCDPSDVPQEQLEPDVAATNGHYEHERNLHDRGARGREAWAKLYELLGEHDLVFVFGERDQMKVTQLTKHLLLVHGVSQAVECHAPFEVSDLACVLANLEEVQQKVRGNRIHAEGLSMSETTPA